MDLAKERMLENVLPSRSARWTGRIVAVWRGLRSHWEAIAVGLGLFVLLAPFAGADPTAGVTGSVGPFTDEAYNVVNARNLVQLGRWDADPWNLYLVNLPFSVLMAGTFKILGVGIIQARLLTVACVSLTAGALVYGLRGAVGRVAAAYAGIAFAGSGLILFYGRLAFLEDLVVLGLTLGTLVLVRSDRLTFRWGLVAGIGFAVAVGAKPNAAFPVAGILLALAVSHRKATWRWIAGCVAAVALAGLAWVLVVWLPNRAAVANDLQIWPSYRFPHSLRDLVHTPVSYLRYSDGVIGPLLGPLLLLSAFALAVIIALRKRLSAPQARMVAASIGWLLLGFGILALVTYRPSRYVVQLIPALAILSAVGLSLFCGWLRDSGAQADAGAQKRRRSTASARALIAAGAIVLACAPGLVQFAGWMRQATYTLPEIQDQFATLVPDGETVAGYPAALLLMKTHATTITTAPLNPAVANADLYATGVRWYLEKEEAPAPLGVPADVWSARQTVQCVTWRGEVLCLCHLAP